MFNVVAPVTPKSELSVVTPVTPNELSVVAPSTPSVELSVVVPVALTEALNDVGCAKVTSVSLNVAAAAAFVPTYTLPWLLVPLPAPPIKLNEPPVLVPVVAVAAPPFTST